MRYDFTKLPARIRTKILVADTEACWQWLPPLRADGYGQVWLDGTMHPAHAVVYWLLVGRDYVARDLELDHLCRNRGCVNPGHLEPVTHLVNVQRGQAPTRRRAQTHCKRGHLLSGENLAVGQTSRGTPFRRCLTCQQLASRASYLRKRAMI